MNKYATAAALAFAISIMPASIASTASEAPSTTDAPSESTDNKKKPTKKKLSAPPPGFEFLLEAQTTQVDIYYGGRFLGAVMADYFPGEISFHQPQKVADLLPNLIDRQRIGLSLSGKLNSHQHAICQSKHDRNCGLLTPETTAVIFDESRYRVDLFVAAQELTVQELTIDKYLPPSDTGLSFIHGLTAAYTKQRHGSDDYSINGNTIVAYEESRVRMFSNISKQNNLEIDVLAFERDFSGRSYQAGLLQTNNQSSVFLPPLQITGARFASNLDTRNDLDFSEGSPLNVFLTNRGRVEVYKDDRLVSSDIYEAGNQSLDTRSLPGGAYNVTIRILQNGRLVKEEQRFYRKSSQVPPADQDIFFIEGGRMMSVLKDGALPDALDNYLLRAGYSSRVLDGLGLDGNIALSETDRMLEMGAFYLGYFLEMDTSVAHTEHDDKGYFFNINSRFKQLSVSANYRRVDIDDETRIFEEHAYLLGFDSTDQRSMRISHPIGSGRVNLETRVNKSSVDTITTYIAGVTLPNYRFTDRAYLSSSVEVSEENDLWQALLTLSINFSNTHWQTSLSHNEQRFKADDGRQHSSRTTSAQASWQDNDILVSDVNVNMNMQLSYNRHQADINAQWESRHGRLGFTADASDSDFGSSQGFSAALSTSFVGDTEGVVIGGSETNQSAVIIDIESPDNKDSYFDVLIDGGNRAYAISDASTIVSLRPFETYAVKLQDNGHTLLSFDQRENRTTLYPGNVKRLHYKVVKVDVVFGRLIDAQGQAIKNAVIDGVEGLAISDDLGMFQAEMNNSTKTLKVRTATSQCTVSVPDYTVKRQIANLGVLRCE